MAKEDFKNVKDIEQPISRTSSGGTGEKFSAKTYELFGDAKDRTDTMIETISNSQTKIQACKAKLSDSEIFMGPIADSCKEALDEMEKLLDLLVENYTTIGKYLIDSMNNYESGDKEAAKLFLSVDENGKISIGTSPLSLDENDLKIITVTDIQKCNSIEEYLDLVMPYFITYCKKYGIKYPGVLALQPVHEHSAPTGIHASCAVDDNNLGGLTYGANIPNATPGSVPGDGAAANYCHFDNFNQYVNGACWNILNSGYYGAALDSNAAGDMEGFATNLISTWAGNPYYDSLIQEYKKYGLEKYELSFD